MQIRIADKKDLTVLLQYDRHVSLKELENSLGLGRVLIAEKRGCLAGWLRWNLFWDNTPFMNMLFVLEGYRGRGLGKALISCWEGQMKEAGYRLVMTSTLSNEEAQHFYRRLHYADAGALLLPGEPLEIIFMKEIKK